MVLFSWKELLRSAPFIGQSTDSVDCPSKGLIQRPSQSICSKHLLHPIARLLRPIQQKDNPLHNASTLFKQSDHERTQQWDTISRFTTRSRTISSCATTGSNDFSWSVTTIVSNGFSWSFDIIYYYSIFLSQRNYSYAVVCCIHNSGDRKVKRRKNHIMIIL